MQGIIIFVVVSFVQKVHCLKTGFVSDLRQAGRPNLRGTAVYRHSCSCGFETSCFQHTSQIKYSFYLKTKMKLLSGTLVLLV
jgi:hypothetical protein